MKTTRFLILGWLATAIVCGAQQPSTLLIGNANEDARQAALDAILAQVQPQTPQPLGFNVPLTPIAEAVTPDIRALAQGLENDPLRIFNYVHDHIRHVLYFGAKKGAELTLLEKSGNDFDQCALLVALLQAAGYTNTSYEFGWMELPYDSDDHKDLHHWLQLSLVNTNWGYTSNYLRSLVYGIRGYPATAAIWGANTFGFQRLWVKLALGSTNYYLDPSFKVSEPITNLFNLASAMQFTSNSLWSAASGTDTGNYVTNLSEASIRGTLTGYTTNLLNYIQSNYPNASVAQVLSGWQIAPSTNVILSQTRSFPTYDWGGKMPILTWTNQPTDLMSTFYVYFEGTYWGWYLPSLQGQRLSLTFDSNGEGVLWQEDNYLTWSYAYNYDYTNVVTYIHHPVGYWDTNANSYVETYAFDQTSTNAFQDYSDFTSYSLTTYNLMYAFEPDWGWLQQRQDKLDSYRQQGYADYSFDMVCETLNVMSLNYAMQTWCAQQIQAAQAGILPQNYNLIGRLGQETGNGYYFDIYMWKPGDYSNAGADAANTDRLARHSGVLTYFGSALEHGVIEQLQNSNLLAASTVKMLELASTNGTAIYLASSTNWQTGANVRSKLVNYDSGTLSTLDAAIAAGDHLLLPQNAHTALGAGTWVGYGYVDRAPTWNFGMFVNGNYGGVVSDPNAVANASYVSSCGHAQPRGRRPFRVYAAGADPVDMANGTFQVERTELSLGQAEPRGISFGSYYNSLKHYYSQAGMAPGWVNNYCVNAQAVAVPQASSGGTTPAQMAPMIAATCAALGIYNDAQPDPKNWMVTDLIAKWAVDQLNKKGVSVQLGKDIVQFVQQPDGRFTPPANCTWTLTKPSNYVLQERHGNTFNFDSQGRLGSIADPYNQALNVTYLSSASTLPLQVTDWKNRYLQFNYNSGVLTNITDSTGRKVIYGYNANGDLTSVTDPESKTRTFTYDTNHEITATFDALSQLVATNIYDGSGHVATQYTQGSTSKAWQIFWSGWQTVVQDPTGSKQRFFYDDSNRLIGFQDALGNLSRTVFDGQDHAVAVVSPLNETNQFLFDGNHNLTSRIDPLGFTNQFIYDSQNNIVTLVDARGNTDRFGYNSQFSLTGLTNGAGDWITLNYNSSDGTLITRTDSGGNTGYSYDSLGQLAGITYPGSLGTEGFLNSAAGDVLTHTNARQFATSFQYSSRRQLTNTIAPTNLTASLSYDAVGNLQSFKDARGFSTINTWSPTRRLMALTLPSTPQGAPVITNIYDNRDWLARTLDPLQQATLFTNDIAGRLLSATDPLLRTTTVSVDADGWRTAITNAAREVTTRQWNARRELTRVTDNATHTVQRAYDGNGNEVTLTNRNGKKWQFQFDGANRLTNTISPLNRQIKQIWNNRGLLQTITEPSLLTTTLGYDSKGRLTNRTDNVGSTAFQYDANNNTTNVIENGKANSWTFDAYDRVSTYKDADGNLVQYRFDANGNITNLIYPGNRTVTYSYDSLNRLTNVTDWASRKTTLTYDLASRVKSITRPNGTQRIINYDAAGETTNIIEKTTTGFPIAFFTLGWTNSGRVAWEFAGPLPQANTSPPTRTMTYDDDNRLATFNGQTVTSDADGNLTWGPLTNNTLTTFTYDARNRLLAAGGLSYSYDALANRTSITNGAAVARFVINPNAALSQVLMRVQNGITNYYVYGAGLLYQVTETATTTNTLTYHYDYRGSTVALTDASGNVTDRIEYSAYGSTTYRAGTNDVPFLFNGRYGVMTDGNGLLYMRARYYNPYLCRFINPDPTGFSGGLNWFAYANGDPISLIDPFGLGAMEGWGGATATWIDRNVVDGLNSVSTSWTAINFVAYMEASIIGGFSDMFRLGQGTANATYNAQNGWDVAIGVTEDIQRAAGIATLVAGGLEGAEGKAIRPADSPNYSVVMEADLKPGTFTASDANHFRQANRQLYQMMQDDPALAARLEAEYPGITAHVTPGPRGGVADTSPPGLTWHHDPETPGNLQLVPRDQHQAPGPVQDTLHPGAKGEGKPGAEEDDSMSNEEIIVFREVLLGIADMAATSWVYLPSNRDWTVNSECAILQSDEVPPELEDEPDAGVPEFAKQHKLIQALPVTVLQDVVRNARSQKPDATLEDLFRAFDYYYKHDAFIKLMRD